MRRLRRVKIIATLGPASNSEAMIEALIAAGADAFRVNMSHGSLADRGPCRMRASKIVPQHHEWLPAAVHDRDGHGESILLASARLFQN